MKSVQKWDFEKRKLESVEISDKCSAYEIDMETKVECPGCGEIIAYGDGYTSRRMTTIFFIINSLIRKQQFKLVKK